MSLVIADPFGGYIAKQSGCHKNRGDSNDEIIWPRCTLSGQRSMPKVNRKWWGYFINKTIFTKSTMGLLPVLPVQPVRRVISLRGNQSTDKRCFFSL